MNLPKRAATLILVALFTAAGVWLNSATPSAAPVPLAPLNRAGPQPTLAPLPHGPAAPAAPAAEAEISYKIAPQPPVIVAPPPKAPAPPSVATPAANLAEKSQTNRQPSDCWQHYRRGWFRRR